MSTPEIAMGLAVIVLLLKLRCMWVSAHSNSPKSWFDRLSLLRLFSNRFEFSLSFSVVVILMLLIEWNVVGLILLLFLPMAKTVWDLEEQWDKDIEFVRFREHMESK